MTKHSKKRRSSARSLVAFQESVQYEKPNYVSDAERRGDVRGGVYRVSPRGRLGYPHEILRANNRRAYRGDAAVCVLPPCLLDVVGAPFANRPTITTLEISESNERFRTVDGVLFDKAGEILYVCPPGKSGVYDVPFGVKHVARDAFLNCSRLTEIRLPSSVETISQAFRGCAALKKIRTPSQVGDANLRDFFTDSCSVQTAIKHDNGLLGSWGETRRFYLRRFSIHYYDNYFHCDNFEGVFGGFADCASLSSIRIPRGVEAIGADAFRGCVSLESVEIPEGVRAIGDSAFRGCSALKTIRFPSTLEYVFCDAFRGCSALRSVVWPASADGSAQAVELHAGAFRGCARLRSLDFPRDPIFVDRFVVTAPQRFFNRRYAQSGELYREERRLYREGLWSSRRSDGRETFEESKKETWRADLQTELKNGPQPFDVPNPDGWPVRVLRAARLSVFRGCDALLRAE